VAENFEWRLGCSKDESRSEWKSPIQRGEHCMRKAYGEARCGLADALLIWPRNATRSRRRGVTDEVLRLLGLLPYRCVDCDRRFYAKKFSGLEDRREGKR
jgi:hypothetical protein